MRPFRPANKCSYQNIFLLKKQENNLYGTNYAIGGYNLNHVT